MLLALPSQDKFPFKGRCVYGRNAMKLPFFVVKFDFTAKLSGSRAQKVGTILAYAKLLIAVAILKASIGKFILPALTV